MGNTTIKGSQVKDGDLKDADIASDAAIAVSKLAASASTIHGTKSSGGVVALTPTEVRTLINVSDGATANAKATSSEVIAGTDDTKFVTAKALLDSNNVKVEILTAGESVVAGDICYLKSDGKFWKGDSDAEATTKGMLVMANATISADATGQFIIIGRWTTTGLTAGAVYYLSGTAGGITSTAPSTTGKFVRVVGYALSTTVFYFKPSETYLEIL